MFELRLFGDALRKQAQPLQGRHYLPDGVPAKGIIRPNGAAADVRNSSAGY